MSKWIATFSLKKIHELIQSSNSFKDNARRSLWVFPYRYKLTYLLTWNYVHAVEEFRRAVMLPERWLRFSEKPGSCSSCWYLFGINWRNFFVFQPIKTFTEFVNGKLNAAFLFWPKFYDSLLPHLRVFLPLMRLRKFPTTSDCVPAFLPCAAKWQAF